jgi:hypothetical protein
MSKELDNKNKSNKLNIDLIKTSLFEEVKVVKTIKFVVVVLLCLIFLYFFIYVPINKSSMGNILIGVGFGLIVVLILGLILYFFLFPNSKNVLSSSAIKKFYSFPEPEKLISLFEKEIKDKDNKVKFSKCFFTKSFMVFSSLFTFEWLHFTEIAWAYLLVTKHEGIFSTSDWKVIVYNNKGEKFETGNENETHSNEILNNLMIRAPFAFYGYENSLISAWEIDRNNFISEVNQRKECFFKNPEKFMEIFYYGTEEEE